MLNPGKNFADFKPGEPLENTFTIYRNEMPKTADEAFKVISHSEQLAKSACVRDSNGRMWCGTCHDPHNEPADPISSYRERCLTCHGNTRLAPDHPSKASNCIGCHMPKREANDGAQCLYGSPDPTPARACDGCGSDGYRILERAPRSARHAQPGDCFCRCRNGT